MKRKLAKHVFDTVRGVSLGVGQGISKGRAKMEAATKALGYLEENGFPQQGQD